jgi:uncharacterized membrane protein (DUF106 family)
MSGTARRVEDLAEEGEAMTDALTEVLEVAEEEGTVTWSDVSDDLTTGQWGRLIETGLLTDADGEGFVVDDPDGVREALGETEADDDEEADGSWSTYDKAAGVAALGIMFGYWNNSIRATIGSAIDMIFGPLESALPFYMVILVLAVLTGLWSTLLQDNLMNMDIMSDYQEQNKELRERRKKAKERGDDEALEEIQKEQMEMMSDNLGMFKAQFRPMVWIMLLTIPVFLWMYWMVLDVGVGGEGVVMVLPLIGDITGWNSGVGPMPAWIIWYFVCSMGFAQIMRKALNVQTSPT